MWIIKRHMLRDENGAMVPAFALLLPFLVLISLGVVEVSTLLFEWHRTGEATRRATRHIAIEQPVADLSAFQRGSVVNCSANAGAVVSCSSGTGANVGAFATMLDLMQAIQPAILPEHVRIIYSDSGLGDPTTPGGIIPLVKLEVSGLTRPLMVVGGFLGMPSEFTFPSFMATQMSNGLGPTN
ncbi:TadE/TadG family type IV pilus assembly protein [Terasakiella sp. SH-1]|uniref:TadE/TadG family type IV pilus assembly protein n=1 Tax=Terasakiella sp. SH-1 TaxID=2560057 RepID=UPI001073947D|nr:TadE/TadG family type IV pilus assembly protein [Terasakiella sp. SH-1]